MAKKHISTLNKLLFDNPVKQDKNATPVSNMNHRQSNNNAVSNIKPATSLEILYFSGSKKITEKKFKRKLLARKQANVKLYYTNETLKNKKWNASRFSKTSGVVKNLRSNYLRGWKEKGIYKAELLV
ncbi:MAG: hypothetical protein R1F54_09415 [Candidatus Zeuxoniibacter abyssi]|nr:MAG: hypothetical protein R1F54_09415 [Candidatus Persebacteraceae bacterium AB1(2)]